MAPCDRGYSSGRANRRLIGVILAATICRIILNVARRFAYPFAPALSRGMGVSLAAVTAMIALNQATGVLGMLFGPLSDRLGYRRMMMAAMGMLVAGMLAAGLVPLYAVVLACLFLAGLGKNIFDPAIQAYAGENIPFERRGLVIGVLEFSWAGSTLIGVPVIGLLIDRYGWRSPFFALAAAGLLGLLTLMLTVNREAGVRRRHSPGAGAWQAWRRVARHREARGALGFIFFVSVANDNLFVVYGAWLEQSFQLSIVVLGLGTGLIGLAELLGEFATAALADRIGLKVAVAGGLFASMLSYLVLPLAGRQLSLALAGLFVVFLIFEFTMVCFLSLATELMPTQRATMMSTVLAAAGIGRVLGALIGGPVWLAGGIAGTASASAIFSALGLAALVYGLKGWRPAGTRPLIRK
ncbi:MAG: MFS transporter [Desulfobacterales bacterium]